MAPRPKRARERPGDVDNRKFRGVSWQGERSMWRSKIKDYWLGKFEDRETAARAYDIAARLIYKTQARLNFPNEPEDPELRLHVIRRLASVGFITP